MKKTSKIYLCTKFFIKTLSLFILIMLSFKSYGNESNRKKVRGIYDISACKSEALSSICISLDKEYSLNLKLMNDPYRIILDFNKKINFPKYNIIDKNIRNKLINNIRFGHSNNGKSRLVFEFNQPVIVSKIFYEKENNSKKGFLKVIITETSRTSFSIAKHVLLQNEVNVKGLNNTNINNNDNDNEIEKQIKLSRKITLPLTKLKNNKQNLQNKFIVLIDPGHGGKDPGAIGYLGTLEKKVTLKVSLKLAEILKKNKSIIPKLTRTSDIYLPLRKRIDLAKINKADIFISIHADASLNKKANGVSVFSLSDKASDKEARIIAQRENAVDINPSIKTNISDPLVIGTLIQMFQRQAMNGSALLAKKIIKNLAKTKLAVNRGHRFAGFTVLKSHNIPSVLIEIGFLSNQKEEKKLLNEKYINNLSKNLSLAIENYLLK